MLIDINPMNTQNKLLALVGKRTMIANVANLDIGSGITLHAEGTLEHDADDTDQPWYVRIRNGDGGAEGIGFNLAHVAEVETLSGGMPRIVLK